MHIVKSRPSGNGRVLAPPASVTGRDGYIITQALVRFVATEQAKPEFDQQWSNLQDARAILNAHCPQAARVFQHEYETPINLVDEKAPREHSAN